ncbi:MAG: SUMF1/EgtB/PvdO family nonheme iron enzyme, partial [Planctomycetes bacterium]|nr:SUMF1/EgtB/PvdO family nonheme iron enzyme [Planctomycetota bacterium]
PSPPAPGVVAHGPSTWTSGAWPEGQDNHPVRGVSWHEAAAFAAWRARATGRRLRLPTSAEWEIAAGWDLLGGKMRRWPWGDEWPSAADEGRLLTPGARAFDRSPFDCFDMALNVAEWTASTPPDKPAARVLRGGHFFLAESGDEKYVSDASRVARCDTPPAWARLPFFGFRLAETPPEPE